MKKGILPLVEKLNKRGEKKPWKTLLRIFFFSILVQMSMWKHGEVSSILPFSVTPHMSIPVYSVTTAPNYINPKSASVEI